MSLPRGGVRGDRSSYGARGVIRVNRAAKRLLEAGMLTVKGTLVLRTVHPFAGMHSREGLWPVRRGVWSPNHMLPSTIGDEWVLGSR